MRTIGRQAVCRNALCPTTEFDVMSNRNVAASRDCGCLILPSIFVSAFAFISVLVPTKLIHILVNYALYATFSLNSISAFIKNLIIFVFCIYIISIFFLVLL